MKKGVAILLAAVGLTAACAALAACGPNAKNVKSIEVTAEEWNTAFAYFQRADAEYTVDVAGTSDITYNANNRMRADESATARSKGGKKYVRTSRKVNYSVTREFMEQQGITDEDLKKTDTTTEMYSEVVPLQAPFRYTQDEDGKWTRTQVDGDIILMQLTGMMNAEYSDFTYSEEKRGYTSSSSAFIYKFGKSDGNVRLVAIYMEVDVSSSIPGMSAAIKSEMHVVFGYSGVANITLPGVD